MLYKCEGAMRAQRRLYKGEGAKIVLKMNRNLSGQQVGKGRSEQREQLYKGLKMGKLCDKFGKLIVV